MNLLRFDKKRFVSGQEGPGEVGVERDSETCKGVLFDDVVIVHDPVEAAKLRSIGFYGTFINERPPDVAPECFRPCSSSAAGSNTNLSGDFAANDKDDILQERGATEWQEQLSLDNSLYLGMEECMYLTAELGILQITSNVINGSTGTVSTTELTPATLWTHFVRLYGDSFIKRYAVYRFLRQNGWVVRSGLLYGVEFLIYYKSPCAYHSSAGVKIMPNANSNLDSKFIAINRQLSNVKKSLICMVVEIPENVDTSKIGCIENIIVTRMTYRYRRI